MATEVVLRGPTVPDSQAFSEGLGDAGSNPRIMNQLSQSNRESGFDVGVGRNMLEVLDGHYPHSTNTDLAESVNRENSSSSVNGLIRLYWSGW